jgi:hypothetical protein
MARLSHSFSTAGLAVLVLLFVFLTGELLWLARLANTTTQVPTTDSIIMGWPAQELLGSRVQIQEASHQAKNPRHAPVRLGSVKERRERTVPS